MQTHILKFGGTSMGSAEAIGCCVNIIKQAKRKNRIVVVVSAMSGVTNELIALAENARGKKIRVVKKQLHQLKEKHRIALYEIDPALFEKRWDIIFIPLFNELESVLHEVAAIGEASGRTLAIIYSFGEKLSSWLMCHAIQSAERASVQISAERVIRTNSNYLEADVDFIKTKKLCAKQLAPILRAGAIPVITGFIGKDNLGNTTLLGRGGSDYTASIIGIGLRAERVEIWTDVDGVMSADPRLVKKTKLWKKISIEVMAEMAYGGAKILHPKTIVAAVAHHIPVIIKNTFNPNSAGTTITPRDINGAHGIVIDKNQVLLHLTNLDMLGGVGFINRCSGIFNTLHIPIDVCATSEVTFTCSINRQDYNRLLIAALKKIAALNIYQTVAKVCVVGVAIGKKAKILARIFGLLSNYKIYTISSNASFNNITFFVDANKAKTVLQKLHSNLF